MPMIELPGLPINFKMSILILILLDNRSRFSFEVHLPSEGNRAACSQVLGVVVALLGYHCTALTMLHKQTDEIAKLLCPILYHGQLYGLTGIP